MFEHKFPEPMNGFRWMLSSPVKITNALIQEATRIAKNARGMSLLFGFTFETDDGDTVQMIPLGRV